VRQTSGGVTTNYAIDLAGGLTQVLADGTNVYLYGNGRIAQYQGTQAGYFLGDALGSVRQLVNGNGNVTLVKSYEPYGELMDSAGSSVTSYGYTSEWTDATGLVYLRARYYAPGQGRFLNRDVWDGDYSRPLTLNKWLYVSANPVNFIDSSGHMPNPLDVNGYVEGRSYSVSALAQIFLIEGDEVVYDFVTLERGRFHYTGALGENSKSKITTGSCLSLLNINVSPYVSAVWGFDVGESVEKDYSGPFIVGQIGLDVPIGLLTR